jgi:hypothetical protein
MVAETPPSEAIAPSAGKLSVAAQAGALLLKVTAMLAGAYALSLAIVWTVPEVTDFGQVSVLKHERLETLGSPKIVLIGGSNLAYGIDSRMIEEATGCPVVNMGMNGYFGVRFLLEEPRSSLQRGDIAVMAFEYDNFFKSVDGSPGSLLGLVKSNPRVMSALSPGQRLDILGRVPQVAQQKVLRLIADGVESWRVAAIGAREVSGLDEIRAIESLAGFNAEGDLVSHLGVDWPYALEREIISGAGDIETEALELMRDFTRDMNARGVSVLTSYTPLQSDAYGENQGVYEALHERIGAMAPMAAPSPPAAFVYDNSNFFDTVYHLNAAGRPLRTQQIITDLQSQFGERAHCPSGQTAQN